MRSFLAFLCTAAIVCAQSTSSTPTGKWVSNLKFFQENNYERLELNLGGTKLTGKLGTSELEGTLQNGRVEATVKRNQKRILQLHGLLEADCIEGTATIVDEKKPEDTLNFTWEVTREPPKTTAAPATLTFEPTEFHHFFSSAIAPALRLNPGDTIK